MRTDKHNFNSGGIKNGLLRKIIKITENEGLYIVLFVCFCIVAGTAVWTVKSNFEKIDARNKMSDLELVKQLDQGKGVETAKEEASQPVINKQNTKQEKTVTSTKETQPAKKDDTKVVSSSVSLTPPVEGKLLQEYAVDKLVYSKTLDQYVIHNGVDIEAPLNTPVCAAAGGTVMKVFNDEKMGKTIWILHSKGFVAKYSNLSVTNMVEEGDVVKKGDVISGVGNTALFESVDVPHLHLEVVKNDKNEDPLKYFPKYKK